MLERTTASEFYWKENITFKTNQLIHINEPRSTYSVVGLITQIRSHYKVTLPNSEDILNIEDPTDLLKTSLYICHFFAEVLHLRTSEDCCLKKSVKLKYSRR